VFQDFYEKIRGQMERVRIAQKCGLEDITVHIMQGIDILDDFINSALGVWGVEIVIDAAEEAPVPVAPAYGPDEKAPGLARRSDHEMFGDMHDAVIGRGSPWVKDLRALGYKPRFCG
jgi:hypothetical protein